MQVQRRTDREAVPSDPLEQDVPFGSNDVQLTGRQWMAVGIILLALLSFVPAAWKRAEKFKPGPDYRIPYSLGNDYWMYDRYCRLACRQDKTLVIGDSVTWGHYVSPEQTLSHYLNQLAADEPFANLSIDGIHPAALAGLIKHYGRAISGKKVILHCNLLWMSSRKHDLQTEKEFSFNHPRLVPQFFPRILCYTESYSGRIAIVVGRAVPFQGWVNHLRVAYFQDTALHTWAMEHPYDSPIHAIALNLPSPNEPPSPPPIAKPWTDKGFGRISPSWVELESSFQWRSFRRTVEILRRRGNEVFVLVGPFNEHMLEKESLDTYRRIKSGVETWLQKEKTLYYVPLALPSELYADASHPLDEGYAMLAKELFENESFLSFESQ